MYALILDGAVVATADEPPAVARSLATGEWVVPANGWSPELLASCGWLAVVEQPQPADTADATTEARVCLVDGAPTLAWVPRSWTNAESLARVDADAKAAARTSLATATTVLGVRSASLKYFDALTT